MIEMTIASDKTKTYTYMYNNMPDLAATDTFFACALLVNDDKIRCG